MIIVDATGKAARVARVGRVTYSSGAVMASVEKNIVLSKITDRQITTGPLRWMNNPLEGKVPIQARIGELPDSLAESVPVADEDSLGDSVRWWLILR
jgi:hypothetical protein